MGVVSPAVPDNFSNEFLVNQSPPRYNIAPTSRCAVVVETGVVDLRWGVRGDSAGGARVDAFNCRVESLASGFWKDSTRCLVPMSGYYEWKVAGKRRTPYYVRFKTGMMVAAGVVKHGEFAIVTTAAATEVAWLHGRTPMFVAGRTNTAGPHGVTTGEWLEQGKVGVYGGGGMEWWEVGGEVGKVGKEGEGLLKPVRQSTLWPLGNPPIDRQSDRATAKHEDGAVPTTKKATAYSKVTKPKPAQRQKGLDRFFKREP